MSTPVTAAPATTSPTPAALAVTAATAPLTAVTPTVAAPGAEAVTALAERTRDAIRRGLPAAHLPARDLGVPAALLALLGGYLAGLRWLDRGGLPMVRPDERRENDVQLVL